jgi:hypothetical protein
MLSREQASTVTLATCPHRAEDGSSPSPGVGRAPRRRLSHPSSRATVDRALGEKAALPEPRQRLIQAVAAALLSSRKLLEGEQSATLLPSMRSYGWNTYNAAGT